MGQNKFNPGSINHIYRNSIQMPYACKPVHGLGRKHGGTDSSAGLSHYSKCTLNSMVNRITFLFQRSETEPRASCVLVKPPTTELHLQVVAFTITCCFYVSIFIAITYNKCILDCLMEKHLEFFKVTSGRIWKISGDLAPLA